MQFATDNRIYYLNSDMISTIRILDRSENVEIIYANGKVQPVDARNRSEYIACLLSSVKADKKFTSLRSGTFFINFDTIESAYVGEEGIGPIAHVCLPDRTPETFTGPDVPIILARFKEAN
jgi:hypothetical protein